MGVYMDGEEMSPGSTLTNGQEDAEKACEFVQQHKHEQSLTKYADCDVRIQDQKPAKGTGTPLIASLQSMPSQLTYGALNTKHNEAHTEHTDVGDSILSNTLVNLNTDTSAYDECVKLGECSSSLQPAEILETDKNDAWYSMYNTLHEISLSDASVFEQDLPFNPNIDQKDEKGYRVKGTGIPLITILQNMPSQHISGALNTEHNEAQIEHTDGVYNVLSNTPTLLRPDADTEDEKIELSRGALVNVNTDTSADDKCLKLEECSSSLQREEIMDISETDTNDDSEAMYDTLLDEISPSDDKAKLELSFNPDLDQMDEEGYTPLYKAALEGNLEGVRDLISRGANLNKPSKGGLRPLHVAAQEGHAHIVDFLILQGANVNVECDLGQTSLHRAASGGHLKVMEYLIQQGSHVNKGDAKNWQPIYAAIQYGHLEAVKYLITEGAKLNRYAGMTPLYAAARFGHFDIVIFFLSVGADVKEENDTSRIPLHGAAINGNVEVMEYLIQQGSDVNKTDAEGWTPFNAAVQEGHLGAIKYLINNGAKPNKNGGMTPLYAAARFGHLDIIKLFISNGADVNEENDTRRIPLHAAAINGNVEVMEYLIQQGSEVNKQNNTGWTPFNAAIQYGHLEAVKYLMSKVAEQNRYAGMTPLYAAARFGHLDIVKFFISKGADVNKEDDKGRIPLHDAATQGHLKVMEYLIQQGSDINKEDAYGLTPFNAAVQYGHLEAVKYLMTKEVKKNRYAGMTPLYAAARLGHLDIVQFLISNSADVNEENDKAMIPLHGAATIGNVEVLKYLIQQGSDVNKTDAEGWTPFNAAVQEGHLGAVKYLMYRGAKQNIYDGMTPIYAAAYFGHLDIIKLFIFNGADVNEEDDKGVSPLHGAASGGHIEVIKYIIQQGSDVNKKDCRGWTPLHAAIKNGHLEGVKLLMAKGAKITRLHGMSPLYIATQYDNIDVVNFLVSSGYDLNERNECGKSPLHAACYNGNIEIVKVLLHHNANVNGQDHDGWTPLHAAAQEGHQDIVDYLALNGADMHVKDIDGLTPLRAAANTTKPHAIEGISSGRGDSDEEEKGGSRYGGHQNLTRGNVTATIKDADKQSCAGKLASQVDNAEEGNKCTQADNAERGADELSLKNLPTRTHDDKKAGNEEHNPFIHAKLKYPDKGEQVPMLDQMEAIQSPETMKRDTTTNGTDRSSPHGPETWQYSEFDPPYLQNTENDGQPPEELESRCHSLIDGNREMRESSSPMNDGSDLPINDTSLKFESFPTHQPAVVNQTLHDGNPVSTQGTSSHPVWKIRTKCRTSVNRLPSIVALVHNFLQMIIALAIILAGRPVLVAGSDITERFTLQAGKPGVVPFHLPWPPNSTLRSYFTIRFESNPRPFCINGEANTEGFKSSSQLSRFTTSVTDLDTSPCVNIMIDNVDTLDEDGYILTAAWHSFENVRFETVKKEIVVQVPPGSAKCFITFSENVDYPYEVHCRATIGSIKPTLSCYQDDQMIDIRGNVTNDGQVTRRIFWLPHITYFSCCSHDVSLNVSETTCNDFEWPHSKETTRQTVTTVPTSVTTPTPQTESHTESGACRQFMLPSLWHLTYPFVYLLYVFAIY